MKIRNFCIIAHIDHWKSTLADRMLEITNTVRKTNKTQVLDRMDLEQERWITIKLTPVRMQWKWYELNLIDTPGHADFQYEVSRSLAAVEGAILLVDAAQWIQAQTLSTLYMAMDQNIEIIAVLNKIDLPAANPERVAQEIENVIWIDKNEIIWVSAKTWQNVEKVLDLIIERIQDPQSFRQKNMHRFQTERDLSGVSRALIFDSIYDSYRWVVSYIKVIDWEFFPNQEVQLIHTAKNMKPPEVWHFNPEYQKDKKISEWQIGYIITGLKSVRDAKIWDTVLGFSNIIEKGEEKLNKSYSIPWFKTAKPFIYAWVYPLDTSDYDKLKESLEKLSLNDSAIEYELEDSKALGFGFRCGFLGMLHMDIVRERISREYWVETIFTNPTVMYLVKTKELSLDAIRTWKNIKDILNSPLYKEIVLYENITESDYEKKLKPRLLVKSGNDMPEWSVESVLEPMAEVEIVWPKDYSGNIMELCQEYRGSLKSMEYMDETRTVWKYLMPLWEIIVDFNDKLKSSTKWYATMNYEFKKYQESDLVKLNIFINNENIEALSWIVHKDKAYYFGRDLVQRLKELIPKHLFAVPIQAGIWNKIIARETISAMRKDVIAKCYGGDVSRKRKLLQKQKEWKKKMKAMWSVNVPSDLFIKMVQKN